MKLVTKEEIEKAFDEVCNEWIERAARFELESAGNTMKFAINVTKKDVIKKLFESEGKPYGSKNFDIRQ